MSEKPTMREELKPCPFCGYEADFERMGNHRQSCIVACTFCGCRLETGEEGDRCGEAWNTRAALAAEHESGWRPIAEAKKDGTLYLAWDVMEGRAKANPRWAWCLASWDHVAGAWCDEQTGETVQPMYFKPLIAPSSKGEP